MIADYILFAEIDGTHYAVILEMKKSFRPRDTKPFEQVWCTRPVVSYLKRLACDEEGLLPQDVVVRHIVVAARFRERLSKPSVKESPLEPDDRLDYRGVACSVFLGSRLPLDALVVGPGV